MYPCGGIEFTTLFLGFKGFAYIVFCFLLLSIEEQYHNPALGALSHSSPWECWSTWLMNRAAVPQALSPSCKMQRTLNIGSVGLLGPCFPSVLSTGVYMLLGCLQLTGICLFADMVIFCFPTVKGRILPGCTYIIVKRRNGRSFYSFRVPKMGPYLPHSWPPFGSASFTWYQ